jgi:hypothetical protein
MCRQQFFIQSWRNDWLVSMKNACSSASTGRRADRMESCLMGRSCTIICIYFSIIRIFFLAEQDCGLCKYVLRTVFLCTPILSVTTSFWNIGEAAIAVESARTVTIICYYFALFHDYCDCFFNYTHYSTTKRRIRGWNSLQSTGQSHHPSRKTRVCSIQLRRRLNQRPRTCLLPEPGRHRPHRPPLGTHDGCRNF